MGLDKIINSSLSNSKTKEMCATAVLKIAVRLPETSNQAMDMLNDCSTSMALELQQRSVEFNELLRTKDSTFRSEIVKRMPPIESASVAGAKVDDLDNVVLSTQQEVEAITQSQQQ